MRDGVSGVLNLMKPTGMTSHDVVARVRRIAGQRSVGHAGTLDPLAAGVLVLLLGRATVLSSYAMASSKRYAAEIVFGVATNTDDAEGIVFRTAGVPRISSEELANKLQAFVGRIVQTPPTFSAIKTDGQPAYVQARRGDTPELEPRPVQIHSLRVLSWRPPGLRILVCTGPGTYIRALARDAGQALDSAAYLHTLVRVGSGTFDISRSVRLRDLSTQNLPDHLLPSDMILRGLPAAFLSHEDSVRARRGNVVRLSRPAARLGPGTVIRLYGDTGVLIALARQTPGGWHAFRVLEPMG